MLRETISKAGSFFRRRLLLALVFFILLVCAPLNVAAQGVVRMTWFSAFIDEGNRRFEGVFAILMVLLLSLIVIAGRNIKLSRERGRLLMEQGYELDFQKRALDEHSIISITDADDKLIYVNDKFADITGYSRQDLQGRDQRFLFSSDKSEDLLRTIKQTLSEGRIWSGETMLKKRDGELFWTEGTMVPLMDAEGNHVKSIAVRTDVTKNKTKEAEHQLRATLDLLQDEVYMFWTDSLQLIYMNKSAMNVTDWDEETIRRETLVDVDTPDDLELFRKRTKPLISGRKKSVIYESTHADRPVEVTLQLIRPFNEVPRFIAVVRDIAERKQVEQAKKDFIATVSHELRTPLTSIKGAIGLILSGTTGSYSDKTKSMLSIAHRNSDRLILIINDILDLEKMDGGQMAFDMKRVDISKVLADAIEAASAYGARYDVTFAPKGMAHPVFIEADYARLIQVMNNLLSNAAKFSSPGSQVVVTLKERKDKVQVSVKDTGMGIPKEAQSHIFDRFTQAHASDIRPHGGTGLGLSIAKTIVERHFGTLGFISEDGKGSVFMFDLPKHQIPPGPAQLSS
ncbi:PAS domain S-box protein [Pseudogemmobacter sp. W21_MBD1_M6]|uniref:sensor histidine kinase n=1 Tax=Pseudogemmobacter sp. W21_MBD1_M6 TaxID=3240271 RepID=UPI003F98D20B